MFVEGQGLGLGEEVGGECDDLDPEPVLGEACEGEVPQAGVLQAADAVWPAAVISDGGLMVSLRCRCRLGVTVVDLVGSLVAER